MEDTRRTCKKQKFETVGEVVCCFIAYVRSNRYWKFKWIQRLDNIDLLLLDSYIHAKYITT